MHVVVDLFLTFMKIGLFTFGGGFAMIPLIEKEIVDKKKWIEKKDILNLFAISQSIPGAVAINTSTLVGYKIAGRIGAIASTIGVVLPSFVIISIIAVFYERVDPTKAEPFFLGINGAIIALILTAALRMFKSAVKDKWTLIIYMIALIIIVTRIISPIFVILLGTIPGIIFLKFFPEKIEKLLEAGKQ